MPIPPPPPKKKRLILRLRLNKQSFHCRKTGTHRVNSLKHFFSSHGHTGTFEDKTWHHLCGTWANHDGVVRLFIDGDCKLTSDRNIHGVIPGTGKLILGQDQDIMGGAFDYQQSFVGEMSHLYIWNTDLGTSVISTLSMHCKEHPYPGYIVRWSDFTEAGIHGNITKRNNSRCLTGQDMLP